MSDTELLPARKPLDQDWLKLLNYSFTLAFVSIFVSLTNMPVRFDTRMIIEPVFSMGYLSLFWLPVLLGFLVTRETVLEGIASHKKGFREVFAGAFVGVVGGGGLSLLVYLLDNFNVRDPLVNWSPQLRDLLSFQRSNVFGFVIWPVIGLILGSLGGSVHVVSTRFRRIVTWALLAVIGFAVFETVLLDLSEGFAWLGAEWLTDELYFIRGGLTMHGAVILAVLGGLFAAFGHGSTRRVKENFTALESTQRTRANIVILLLSAAALVVLPLFLGGITNELLANVGLFVLLALGLNIVVGLAGILDLGYVAFFAIGGYSAALITTTNRADSWPSWVPALTKAQVAETWWIPSVYWLVALIAVVLFAALAGLFIGAPVIRMRGDYLAIVTLGFGEIIRLMFQSDWLGGYTGAAQGVTNIPGFQIFNVATIKGTDPRAVFYLVLFFCVIAIYVSWRLERSRLGRAWMAIREDESVAEAMGIDTVKAKLMAFVVGAVLASFSGAILAAKVGSVFPTSFEILVSIVILVVVIVGGMGNIVGVIVGALVLIGILGGPTQPGLLAEFSEYKLLIYGVLLIVMMLKRPEGLVPNVRRTRELHQDEYLQDAWLKGEIDTDSDDEETALTATASPPNMGTQPA
ncbi:MAG: branched-chain amino acid ABC transporter permease [Acidimicrobiia bacterium]|nr:branched-chain amino acid ABC transporter permease [Acidimicrobiia bacterium]MCY4457616.1 branched-chain amino acid ABC transporter permease [Acidimicrobiaceae bacterium]